MIRLALIPIFALALILATGGVARAETDNEEQVADPGAELFRQALSDYRTALAELRELCIADDDAGVATARRRAPKELTACQRGMKELKVFLVEVRKTAHWVTQRHAEEKEARRVAKEEERQAKERAEEEARESAEREKADKAEKAEKAKRDEAARLAEKARQAEKAKQQEQQKSNDSSKQKATYERELADLRKKLQTALNDWAKSERAANEYRLLAETKTGDERAKYEQKAVAEQKRAAELHALTKKLQAKIAEYEKSLSSLPKSNDLVKKAQKLRDQIRSLEDTATYKRGLEQDAIDKANEYRAIANERDGAERDKYLSKAAEMDRQADEWGRLASDYEEQRDRAQAELDALGL
jgi:hypothetical protein